MARFSGTLARKLRYYVYLYVDPRDNTPFYVGKGRGNRCYAHSEGHAHAATQQRLVEPRKLGLQPRIEFLRHGLEESEALIVEAAAIDLLGLESLSNRVRGHGIRQGGRASVDSVAAILSEKQAKIREPAMLINIRRAFRHDMSLQEIYDATRAAWKVGWKRDRARYALSVFGGIVREVFEIAHWLPAGSTMRAHDKDGRPRLPRDRWEFVGRAADELLRKRYVNHSVRHSLPQGAQNPIMYVNCD